MDKVAMDRMEEFEKERDADHPEGHRCHPLSKRWILAFTGFLGSFILYSHRVNISVAIICMVRSSNHTTHVLAPSDDSNRTLADNTGCGILESQSHRSYTGEFEWDKTTQSMILSAFFYGYLMFQIIGGWVAGRFGGKLVLGIGMLTASLATVLLPSLARVDYRMAIALRVVMGLSQSAFYPSFHSLWGRWAPPAERTKLTSFCYSGTNLGTIVTYALAGYLCAEGFDNGWGSIFYVTGGSGVLWCMAWFCLVSNSPQTHPTISREEKDYIVNSIGNVFSKTFQVPWRSVATSRAMWVCLCAHICNNWMHYTLLTSLPLFMKEVLKFDIQQNGLLSSLPYLAQGVTMMSVGQLADFLRARWLSTTATRRLFQSFSFVVSGVLIICVGFVSCQYRNVAVVLLTLAVGIEGFCYAGYMVNQVDFAPQYAGVLYGITNTISTIPGVLAPIAVGALTPNKTQEEWKNVFYLCGAFTFVGAVVFGGFARGEVEPWAKKDPDESEMKLSHQ